MAEGEQSIGRGSSEPGTLQPDPDESEYGYIHLGGPFSLAVNLGVKDPVVARQWAAATLVDNLGLPPRFALIGTGRIRSQRSEATSLVHQEQPVQASVPQEIPQP